jgi:phosphonoacetaldehyde hydrolase
VSRDETRIRLVVFDWAGTAVDHGSCGPVQAFVRALAAHGVEVSADEARGPMGLSKRDHLRALLAMPEVARRWRQRHGGGPTANDLEELYCQFVALQLETVDATLVPELLECVTALRSRGIAIGATTGYFREAAERVFRRAAEQGYRPDHCVCAEDVPAGRPAPWMVFRILEALGIFPPAAVVKVGDTVPDICEGLAAGAWSVGVVRSSSEVGCTTAEWAALPAAEQVRRAASCRAKLLAAGAHAVVETLAELPALIDEFNARLGRSEKP